MGRTPGWIGKLKGFAGVTSANIVPSNSRLISHGDVAFFLFFSFILFLSPNRWKEKIEKKES